MFYIILGKSRYPISNQLFSEADIQEIQSDPKSNEWTVVPIAAPWKTIQWNREGGKGNSAYPESETNQTIRVPKAIAHEVQKYAVWLWSLRQR